jgi:NAD(P)-dependent dehydrogenase (short-subunit alcohol dehydrogenase family)
VVFCARGAQGLALDVRDSAALSGFVAAATERLGGLDIVVSNVSTRPQGEGETRWREGFEADLLQHVRLAEAVTPALQRSGSGSLVFVASIAAVMTQLLPEEVAYGAMKAGLVNYAGAMAERHGRAGMRVNCVSPGPIDFQGGAWDAYRRHQPKLVDAVVRMAALGRLGEPADVARAVAFLASPAARHITGVNLRIDGGTIKAANF